MDCLYARMVTSSRVTQRYVDYPVLRPVEESFLKVALSRNNYVLITQRVFSTAPRPVMDRLRNFQSMLLDSSRILLSS